MADEPARAAPVPGMRSGRELEGRVALVTGGARNIGRAISRALAAGGATVMVNARSSRAEAAHTVAMIEAEGGRATSCLADVSRPAQVARLVAATLARHGRLDILVHNAALREERPFEDITLAEWRRVLGVVLDGAFLTAQAALPHLRAAGAGAVVLIGGQTGHQGAVGRAHVVTAKAGLAGLTKALALEFAPACITVNCVVPGAVRGDRGDGAHAVRPRWPLPDRAGDPRQRRRLPAVSATGSLEAPQAVIVSGRGLAQRIPARKPAGLALPLQAGVPAR